MGQCRIQTGAYFINESIDACSVQMRRKGIVKRSEMIRTDIECQVIDDRHYIFRRTCHGDPGRSFWINGHPLPLCARCSLFYPTIPLGMILGILILIFLDPSSLMMSGLTILLISPLAIDGLTQYHGKRSSNNILRAITGAAAGIGSGIALVYVISRMIFLFQ